MIFYLDTSALLKRYKTERGTDVVDRLYSSKEDLITSQYGCVEVASVATRALKGRVLDSETYMRLMSAFTQDLRDRLMPWPMSSEMMWQSFADVMEYGLRSGDGLHVTSAKAIKEYAGEEFCFVASDRELLNAGRSAGMEVLDPEAIDAMEILAERGL